MDTELTPAQVAFITKMKAKFVRQEALTQCETIFLHLMEGKGLTGPQCLRKMNIYRLASRIHDLRHKPWAGFHIDDQRLSSGLALYFIPKQHRKAISHTWKTANTTK